jgi:hypothetical protein
MLAWSRQRLPLHLDLRDFDPGAYQLQLIKMLCLRCSRGLNAIPVASIVSRIAGKPALKSSAKRYIELLRSLRPANSAQNLHIPTWTLSTDDISSLCRFQTISGHHLPSSIHGSRRRGRARSPTENIVTSCVRINPNPLRTTKYIQPKSFCQKAEAWVLKSD